MMVRVKVPTQLRSLTGGRAELDAAPGHVSDVIAELEASHPGLSERLLDESGALRRFVNVYVNDEDVRFLQGPATRVPEGAVLAIIPAVAGGSRDSSLWSITR